MKEKNHTFWSVAKEHWKNDLLAAISVSLVALPLGLGIAVAAEVPPISGLIAAIIGGVVTTLFRGGHVSINGPGAGIIVVILTGSKLLADADGSGFPYVLAAICMAGLLQILMGILKLGRFGEVVPNAVVHGMLAAIGIIILVKQLHVGLGHHSDASSAMDSIFELPVSLFDLHPIITLVMLISLGIALLYPKINNKLFRAIPAPVWILIVAIPFVYFYQDWLTPMLEFTSEKYIFPDSQLIQFPDDLWDAIVFPDFSKISQPAFWLVVFSVMIISTIEALVSAKAVDSLDPLERKTNLNKDLVGIGLSTAASSMIGGLPVVTVIVRSSVNISHGGRSGLSNVFHGLILLLFLILLKPVLEEVPMAALAAILVHTGFKLAAPRQFADAYDRGEEQLLVMVATVLSVLLYGLLWGIFLGVILMFLVQWIKSRMDIKAFIIAIFRPNIIAIQKETHYEVSFSGVFNFLNLLKIKQTIKDVPRGERVEIKLHDAILIDFSVMEYFNEFGKKYTKSGGKWMMVGLDHHETTCRHPNSLQLLSPQHQHSPRWMTDHQKDMMKFAAARNCQFVIGKEYQFTTIKLFPFFKTHPIEFYHNTITGLLPELNLYFTVADITFDEGALQERIVYDTTVIVVEIREHLPTFVVEKEQLYDRIRQFRGFEDIDFDEDPEFSNTVLLKAEKKAAVKKVFGPELRALVTKNNQFHIECNGSELLFFGKNTALNEQELVELFNFALDFIHNIYHK